MSPFAFAYGWFIQVENKYIFWQKGLEYSAQR